MPSILFLDENRSINLDQITCTTLIDADKADQLNDSIKAQIELYALSQERIDAPRHMQVDDLPALLVWFAGCSNPGLINDAAIYEGEDARKIMDALKKLDMSRWNELTLVSGDGFPKSEGWVY